MHDNRSAISRRELLGALAAGLALAGRAGAEAVPEAAAIFAASDLGAGTGYALADAGTGAIIEAHQPDLARPPASVVKIFTALQALELLSPDYRFATRLVPVGAITGGVLRGDLVLAGSGDPLLDTDRLGDLAKGLRGRGITAVTGRFLVATGALPAIAEIEAGQPEDAGYNPTISGVNLNFNRVYFAWEPGEAGPRVSFSAPGERFTVPVAAIGAELRGTAPAPRHRVVDGREIWEIAPDSLRGRGSLWLPVRAPGSYAGEVFRALAAQAGTVLPAAEVVHELPLGAAIVSQGSAPLIDMMRGMLFHSTNLTAEVVGLRAAQATGLAPATLAASARATASWARTRLGLTGAVLVNHSGLTDRSVLTAGGMTGALVRAQVLGLPELLRERPVRDAERQPLDLGGIRLLAKTGTLDFASALAGYIEGRGGRRLAFAIFAADPEARAAIPRDQLAEPPGAAAWAARARSQEHALLRRWVALHLA